MNFFPGSTETVQTTSKNLSLFFIFINRRKLLAQEALTRHVDQDSSYKHAMDGIKKNAGARPALS